MTFRPFQLPRCLFTAAALAIGAAAPALACPNLDDAPSSRWTVERSDGRAWLVTPCGERFFSLGVNVINPSARDPSMQRDPASQAPVDEKLAAWIAEARGRVTQWNFNSAGGWSLTPYLLKMPEVVNLELGRNSKFHWFDPFEIGRAHV